MKISMQGETATINTLSSVTPIVDIYPSIADNQASSSILKSANLDELGPKSTLCPLPLGDFTYHASLKQELLVVKPKRTIFVSPLSCDTSVDSIKCFVKSKIKEPFEFDRYKMRPSLY